MNKREAASLAFKIAGLFAIIQAIEQSQSILILLQAVFRAVEFGMDLSSEGWWQFVLEAATVVGPFGLLIALGILLLSRSDRLAGRMFDDGAPDPSPQTDAHELQAIAFSVLGVFVVAMAIPSLAAVLVNASVRDIPNDMRPSLWPPLVKLGLQLGIGAGLFFKARPLSTLWRKLRTGGIVYANHGTGQTSPKDESGV